MCGVSCRNARRFESWATLICAGFGSGPRVPNSKGLRDLHRSPADGGNSHCNRGLRRSNVLSGLPPDRTSQSPPAAMNGRFTRLEAHYAGCAESRRTWRIETHCSHPGANSADFRRNQQRALRGVRFSHAWPQAAIVTLGLAMGQTERCGGQLGLQHCICSTGARSAESCAATPVAPPAN